MDMSGAKVGHGSKFDPTSWHTGDWKFLIEEEDQVEVEPGDVLGISGNGTYGLEEDDDTVRNQCS